jgi:hypothetical protein
MKKRAAVLAALWVGAISSAFAQSGGDGALFERMRVEGMEHSQVDAMFEMLTTEIGPRLTASPAHKRAAEWARDELKTFGLSDSRLEPWKFGRGWTAERVTVEMIAPRYMPVIAYADGWSAATSSELTGAPVLAGGKSPEQLEAMKASLKGAIVFTQPLFSNFVRKDRPNPADPSYAANSAAYATSVGNAVRPASSAGETPVQRASTARPALVCCSSRASASTAPCS